LSALSTPRAASEMVRVDELGGRDESVLHRVAATRVVDGRVVVGLVGGVISTERRRSAGVVAADPGAAARVFGLVAKRFAQQHVMKVRVARRPAVHTLGP